MKIKLLLATLLLSAAALGQAVRYDTNVPTLTYNNLYTPPTNATAAVYVYPGAGISCSGGGCSPAATYTSDTALATCSTTLPLTGLTSTTCTGNVSNSGGVGFWALPGRYQWCVTSSASVVCANVFLSSDVSATTTISGVNTYTALQTFNAGAVGVFFKSTTINPAATGAIRLASGDQACWRNAANTGDICISKTAGDVLQYSNIPLAQTIGTGTAVMTTAAIASGACGTTVTVSAPGALTTDIVAFSWSGGVVAANPGELTLNASVTANNVNFAYCNATAGSVTPNAATLNWRVTR